VLYIRKPHSDMKNLKSIGLSEGDFERVADRCTSYLEGFAAGQIVRYCG